MDFLIRSVSLDASLSPIPFLFGISKDLISMEIFQNVSLVTMEFHMAQILLSHFLIYNFYFGGCESDKVHEVSFMSNNFSSLLLAIHYLVQHLLERIKVLEPLTVKCQKFDAHFGKIVDNIMIRYHARSLLSVCSVKYYEHLCFTFSWIIYVVPQSFWVVTFIMESDSTISQQIRNCLFIGGRGLKHRHFSIVPQSYCPFFTISVVASPNFF